MAQGEMTKHVPKSSLAKLRRHSHARAEGGPAAGGHYCGARLDEKLSLAQNRVEF